MPDRGTGLPPPPMFPALPPTRDRQFNERNLQPTKVVGQHTVPRHYLAHFTDGDSIEVYDLQEGQSSATSLKRATVQVGYYDLVLEDGTRVSIEDWLAKIESKAAPILERLVADPDQITRLKEKEEDRLARYVCAQRFRTQWFREFERASDDQSMKDIKATARAYIDNTFPKDEADEYWKEWQSKPREWWLNETRPLQDADGTAHMLSEVQGFASSLMAMPWRTGLVNSRYPLYTSDNPVAAYAWHVLPNPPRLGTTFVDHTYMLPLSREVLFIAEAFDPLKKCSRRGLRRRKDFSAWESSFARHVVTRSASRFVYGTNAPVPVQCASACFQRIDHNKGVDAVDLQGYNPYGPRRAEA